MKLEKKLVFIFNPKAGKGKIKTSLMEIVDIFNKGGYEVIIRATQAPRDAYEQVKKYADQVDLIVCSGGDGSVSGTFRCLKSHRSAPADDHSVRAAAVAAEAPMILPTVFLCPRICWMLHL